MWYGGQYNCQESSNKLVVQAGTKNKSRFGGCIGLSGDGSAKKYTDKSKSPRGLLTLMIAG